MSAFIKVASAGLRTLPHSAGGVFPKRKTPPPASAIPCGASLTAHRSTVVVAQVEGFGAENVREILNKYFGILVEIVYRYGGDVIRIAGDALVSATLHSPDER
jgi:hypothetical protein